MLSELELINKNIFEVCGIELKNIQREPESQEYFAHTFELGNQKVKFRVAKITPTKVGQFVTIWKRNKNGMTEPPHVDDEFDFYIIAAKLDSRLGVFLFNKRVLSENKILTNKDIEGKRGIRIYPEWDLTPNKQAQKTQRWQKEYFVEISDEKEMDIEKVKKILRLD